MAEPTIAMIPSGYKDGKLYSVLPSSGAGDFTFSRGGNATRVNSNGTIETKTDDTPRLDYTDGGCPNLLLEPQSTNQVTYSEDLTQWNALGTAPTLTSGQASPDGGLNATRIQATLGSTFLNLGASATETSNRSIYAKSTSGNGTACLLNHNSNTNNTFNLTEDWQRFELTGSNATGGTAFYIDFRGSGTLSDIIVFGAQSEEQSSATSYIASNSGTTTTRLADAANSSGNSTLINSTEGVLYAEIAALSNDLTNRTIALSDSDSSDHVRIYYTTVSNSITVAVKSNGTNQYVFSNHNVGDVTDFIKIAVKFKQNDYATFINGVEVDSQTTASSTPIGLDRLNFDNGTGASDFYGKCKEVRVYDEALTDAELISLTS